MKRTSMFLIFIFLFGWILQAQDLTGVRIYINPGHGGYDADDRNIVIPPFTSGDPNGFWESKSNLHKGLMLKEMLDEAGATSFISRTQNRTEDDLYLSQIVRAANESNADFMLSIHSNAGAGIANYVLQLYAGVDPGDNHNYTTPTPHSETSRLISTEIAINQYSNQLNSWSANYTVRGDKTFGRTAMGWSDGYGVLRGLTVPGVISEGSMHDYIPETYRLMNMEYKWLEAWHFLKAFNTYFKKTTLPKGNIAGMVKDKFLPNESSYYKLKNSLDEQLSVNDAKVILNPGNIEYQVDDMNNGIFLFKDLEPGSYTLTVEHPDYHTEVLEAEVKANETTYLIVKSNKIRNTPPQIVDYGPIPTEPNAPVLASSVVWFRFNWDVDVNSAREAFKIEPEVDGEIIFKESNFVMEFIPNKPLDVSTEYTVTLDQSLSHPDGLSMDNEFSFKFTTTDRNHLELLAAYPSMNETQIHFESPTFIFVFDKKLQTSELINGLQVYDKSDNMLVKNKRTLKHNAFPEPMGSTQFTVGENLVPGEEYYVKFERGIMDIDGIFLSEDLIIPFTAADVRNTDNLLVEDFEATGLMQVATDENQQVKSASVTRSTSDKLFGSSSYNLKYEFDSEGGGEVTYLFNTPTLLLSNDSVVGLHIKGDLSGNQLVLLIADDTEKIEIAMDSIHYAGWKFKEKALDQLPVGKEMSLLGFKIKQSTSPTSTIKGSIFVDNMLCYNELINFTPITKDNQFEVYPNPATDYIKIVVKDNSQIDNVKIYSLDGKLLLHSKIYDAVDVSTLSVGTYVLQINTNRGKQSLPIMIK